MKSKRFFAFLLLLIVACGMLAPVPGLAAAQKITKVKVSATKLVQGKTVDIQYKLAKKGSTPKVVEMV